MAEEMEFLKMAQFFIASTIFACLGLVATSERWSFYRKQAEYWKSKHEHEVEMRKIDKDEIEDLSSRNTRLMTTQGESLLEMSRMYDDIQDVLTVWTSGRKK